MMLLLQIITKKSRTIIDRACMDLENLKMF